MTGTTTSRTRIVQWLAVLIVGSLLVLGSTNFLSAAEADDIGPQIAERRGQVSLYAEDVDGLADWYVEHFGFQNFYTFPGGDEPSTFVTLAANNMYLTISTYDSIRDNTPFKKVRPAVFNNFELVMLVNSFEEVDEYADNLRAAGEELLMEPTTQPWNERSAYVADPEGNLVHISTHQE